MALFWELLRYSLTTGVLGGGVQFPDCFITDQAGEAVVERTEESVINAFLTFVMKLSEATFRPMFLKVSSRMSYVNVPTDRQTK